MFATLLLFLKKIPWQLWLLAGAFLLVWLYGNYRENLVKAEWEASVERGKKIVAELEEKANQINEVVVEKVVTKTEVIRGKTEYIIKEVPVYIPADTPDLPAGFRVLHDAAARSQLPSETSTSGSPVRVADAAITITQNYETCHLWRIHLTAWEEWYQEQAHFWQSAQRRQQ